MTAQPPQLDYGPFFPWHRRKKIRRRIILLLFVVVAVFTGVRWGPRAWHRVHLYWAQRQCLNYLAPQGQLIYATTSDPSVRNDANAFRQPPPACWVRLGASLPDPVAYPMAGYYVDTDFDTLAPAPVFIHGRRSGGKKRLVVVQFGAQVIGGGWHSVFCARVIDPATLLHGPTLLWEQSTIIPDSLGWDGIVRIFAGSADESDSSHFVIGITVNGQPMIIDGWLQNADSVKMEVRDGPAKP
jgi:hypothetical protein